MADVYVATTGNDSTGDGSSGNPYATPLKACAVAVSGDRVWIKSAGSTPDYVVSSWSSNGHNASGAVLGFNDGVSVEGYITTPGDGTLGCVTIQNGTNTAPWVVFVTASQLFVRFITLDCNGKGNSQYGFYQNFTCMDCVVKNFSTLAFGGPTVRCIADSTAGTGIGFTVGMHFMSVAKACSQGFSGSYGTASCIAESCTTGFTTGNVFGVSTSTANACGTGFASSGQNAFSRCLARNCTTYGFDDGGNHMAFTQCEDYGSAANRLTTAMVADVTILGADPLPNTGTGNYTVAVGSAARSVSASFPGISTTTHSDIGAVQSAASGSGGLLRPASMAGGF